MLLQSILRAIDLDSLLPYNNNEGFTRGNESFISSAEGFIATIETLLVFLFWWMKA